LNSQVKNQDAPRLIIAIDGPSGAGKSTLSKALARELGYTNIDTGAMYRSVALLATRRRIPLDDVEALRRLCRQMKLEFRRRGAEERVFVDGQDVSGEIRSPEVSLLTSKVAACPSVREELVRMQQHLGRAGGVVLEGRDIGTVVFPHADLKFFLSASAAERGRRRFEELRARGIEVDLEQTIAEVETRDAADSSREHAPLCRALDAIEIDSTKMPIDQVLQLMLARVQARLREAAENPSGEN
jgi:cytidylate kinase